MPAHLEKEIREQELEALSQYQRGLAEAPMIYRAQGFKATEDDTGFMVFVASEESPDRAGDLISVDGWDTGDYEKNPILLFAHNHAMPPIGRVPKVWKNGKQLLNTIQWDTDDPLALALMGKYQRGFMKGESVGFRPLEFKERDGGESKGIHFLKQELLEISLVSVPMHPNALKKMMGAGQMPMTVPDRLQEVLWVPVTLDAIRALVMDGSGVVTESSLLRPEPEAPIGEDATLSRLIEAIRAIREEK